MPTQILDSSTKCSAVNRQTETERLIYLFIINQHYLKNSEAHLNEFINMLLVFNYVKMFLCLILSYCRPKTQHVL